MKYWTYREWLVVAGITAFLSLGPAWWVLSSYMEAKSYNRVTGAHVTTWDAMWIELRVQDPPK